MSGLIIQKLGELYIKDGEQHIPLHPNSLIQAQIGRIFEFEYVIIDKIKVQYMIFLVVIILFLLQNCLEYMLPLQNFLLLILFPQFVRF